LKIENYKRIGVPIIDVFFFYVCSAQIILYSYFHSYAVLGENSSGKSVLLRCLSGFLEQDGGDVIMLTDDAPVVASGSSDMVGSGVGAEQTVTRRRPKIGYAPQVCVFGH